jgi:hypothetical protein
VKGSGRAAATITVRTLFDGIRLIYGTETEQAGFRTQIARLPTGWNPGVPTKSSRQDFQRTPFIANAGAVIPTIQTLPVPENRIEKNGS